MPILRASAEKNFRLHFSVTKMGSRGTFMLRTASNPCLVRLAGEPAWLCAELALFMLALLCALSTEFSH